MSICFKCGEKLSLGSTVGFKEFCPKCDADIHCCKNCLFFDLNSYNNCRESQAERIVDKEKANFCDYFKLGNSGQLTLNSDKESKAKNLLEDLFKK